MNHKGHLFTGIKYFLQKTGNIKLLRANLKFACFPWVAPLQLVHYFLARQLNQARICGDWRVVKCLTLKKKRQQLIELCETALENDLAEQRSVRDHVFTWWWSRVKITEVYKSNRVRYKE